MNINDMKILICDDSILARKQLKDIVSELGTPTFIEATDGQGAIDKYKESSPDLVFLDIVMPKKDGNTQSQLKCALQAGAKDFIQKPLDKQQVMDIVTKIAEGR